MPRESTLLKVTSPSVSCPGNKIFRAILPRHWDGLDSLFSLNEGGDDLIRLERDGSLACFKIYKELSSTMYKPLGSQTNRLRLLWIS